MSSRDAPRAVVVFLLLFTGPLFAASTLVVGPGEAYGKIGDAIAAAIDGDTVLVKPGTYHEAIDFGGKKITVRSEGGKETTTIDATGMKDVSVVSFRTGETAESVLEGFTVTGGTGSMSQGENIGGGILVEGSEPTIRACRVTRNTALRGGGIGMVRVGSSLIEDCEVSENNAAGAKGPAGGGIYAEMRDGESGPTLVIRNSSVSRNQGTAGSDQQGGGICVRGIFEGRTLILDGCTIMNNVLNGGFLNYLGDGGGGIYADSVKLVMTGGEVSGNSARQGGGIFLCSPDPGSLLAGTAGTPLFLKANEALDDGGGLYFISFRAALEVSHVRFENNRSRSPQAVASGGGGMNISEGSALIRDCEFVANTTGGSGGGLRLRSLFHDGLVLRTRFIGNQAEFGGGIYGSSAIEEPVFISDCLFEANQATRQGGGVFLRREDNGGMVTLYHCDLVANTSSSGVGGIDLDSGARTMVRNCILWGNQPSDFPSYGASMISFSDVRLPATLAGSNGMLSVDPRFVDPTADPPNLDLRPDSPLIDAGGLLLDHDGASITEDLAGRPRVTDGNGDGKFLPDMGAFEAPGPPQPRFIRGDVNGDGRLTITDPIVALKTAFDGTAPLPCEDAADANDDGRLDLTDPIALLGLLFLGAGPLPAPYPVCGPDPTDDALAPCTLHCP